MENQEEKFAGIVNDAIEAKTSGLSESIEAKASAEEVEALKTEVKSATDAAKAIGEEVTKLKEGKVAAKKSANPVAFEVKERAEEISKFVDQKSGVVTFDVKAGQTIDATAIGDNDRLSVEMVPGVGQIPVRRPFMQDLFRTVPTTKEYVRYVDQATINRDAQNTIRCTPITTTTDITWETRDIQIKKVKDYITVCLDMMDDYDYVTAEIENLIRSSVELKKDDSLLNDDGTGSLLNGVLSIAATFNAATAGADYFESIDDATLYDLICVVGAQISAAGQENKWFATDALLNPKDAKLMRLSKDADGNYLMPPFVAGVSNVDGIRVIENPLIPEGEMLVGDFRQGTVYQSKTAQIEMSFENRSNFEDELVTIKAYERLNLLIRNVDANAFIHVPDIAAGITAITKP